MVNSAIILTFYGAQKHSLAEVRASETASYMSGTTSNPRKYLYPDVVVTMGSPVIGQVVTKLVVISTHHLPSPPQHNEMVTFGHLPPVPRLFRLTT